MANTSVNAASGSCLSHIFGTARDVRLSVYIKFSSSESSHPCFVLTAVAGVVAAAVPRAAAAPSTG